MKTLKTCEVATESAKPILNRPKVKYTINLDWLELMCSGPLVEFDSPLDRYDYDGGNILLAKIDNNGTALFKYSWELLYQGKLFAKVHTNPRSPEMLKPESIQLQVMNNKLYEVGCVQDLAYILVRMGWAVLNVIRFDIALDGVKVMHLLDRYLKAEIQKKGKAKVHAHFTGKRELEGANIGSAKSNKWITMYDKTEELEKSHKTYIKDFWERTGIDTSGKVERLELKLRNEEIKKIFQFHWKELDNFEFLASIFRTTMENFFEFIEIGSDSNSTRAKKIEFIDWDCIGAVLLEKCSTRITTEIHRMKHSSKTNYWCFLASGRQYYADIAQEQAMNINAIEWYVHRLEKWKKEYYKRAGHNADGVIHFQYILNFETYEGNEQLKLFAK